MNNIEAVSFLKQNTSPMCAEALSIVENSILILNIINHFGFSECEKAIQSENFQEYISFIADPENHISEYEYSILKSWKEKK